MDVLKEVFMSKLNIVNITKEDIDKLAAEHYAEGGPLYHLRDLRGIEWYCEIVEIEED